MRFRQVHLDFHTSEAIDAIGSRFSKEQFQSMLQKGRVDSITIFSKCHHGWAYHPSEANEIHPGLGFDLLGRMIEAAHEIGVKTPVYLSAGLDEKLARQHPDWLVRDKEDRTGWARGFLEPGYHEFCFNTPYLDLLLDQIEEVVRRYDADGIFLDIVGVRKCYCQYCVRDLRAAGQDPRDEKAVLALGERTFARYTEKVRERIHGIKPGLGIFHNSGHIRRGRRDLARMNTHLELESLPTGGWGYDHFPLSARYAQTLGMNFLGMTGKFHTTWGEFGGYKHPNALRYEAALSLANGARISVGDQLHPDGLMDEATYELIGAAYREVETKEAWCADTENVADVALLTLEALEPLLPEALPAGAGGRIDAGAARMLLEGKILFDVIDLEADFERYKVVVLPDQALLVPELEAKLRPYLEQGGKVLATGRSGLDVSGERFGIDLGVKRIGDNPYRPDYFRPGFELPSLKNAAFVFYGQGQRIELDGGTELGLREDPYFNRDVFTFCSHQHTPSSRQTGGPGMVESASGIYIAWNVFEDYATKGSLPLKETVLYALDRLLGASRTLRTNLPAQGVATVQRQAGRNRYVAHLLYASPVKRGDGVEVIEDLVPLRNVEVTLRLPGSASDVYLAPQGTKLQFTQVGEDGVRFVVPEFECHQMVVVQMEKP
ncbi:beta-galactosidase trimerization domain-containing protein [Cohnella zeiphila]|uniref:Beta-galactosidase trimerization domain-containing protein n=1 Tax=Cohnella zeiphila TaxID=2761120 RepID=A0A7X0SGD8_9BACL|nr:beta-galactosidase trimerization domain-containing protein [Cohnella zeiphila]MBB6729481.1 beta-galactosidase trimerization domain-containing protein [Cohnella zeiphila]